MRDKATLLFTNKSVFKFNLIIEKNTLPVHYIHIREQIDDYSLIEIK